MKAYIQFFCGHKEALGSDGILIVDARLTTRRMQMEADTKLSSLREIKPWYNGYEIRHGDLKNYRVIVSKLGKRELA